MAKQVLIWENESGEYFKSAEEADYVDAVRKLDAWIEANCKSEEDADEFVDISENIIRDIDILINLVNQITFNRTK